MSGCVEHGKCEICGKETFLQRTYFRYDIKCKCHSPNHFELVTHCKDCKPIEPKITRITIETETLKDLALIYSRKNKLNNLDYVSRKI